MQFATFAVLVHPVPVEYAVGDVRSLLDFGDQDTFADCMDRTRRNKIGVIGFDRHACEDVGQCAVGYVAQVLLFGDRAVEPEAQFGVFFAVDYVPHFGFAVRVMAFQCKFVVRMHLDRKRVLCVDQLDQQRKQQAEFIVNLVAYQFTHVYFDQLFEAVSG